jgi:hypothetical protein
VSRSAPTVDCRFAECSSTCLGRESRRMFKILLLQLNWLPLSNHRFFSTSASHQSYPPLPSILTFVINICPWVPRSGGSNLSSSLAPGVAALRRLLLTNSISPTLLRPTLASLCSLWCVLLAVTSWGLMFDHACLPPYLHTGCLRNLWGENCLLFGLLL